MKRQTKLTSEEREALEQAVHQQTQQPTGLEFANAEEMLRHDAIHTPIPPRIAHRLQQSIDQLPPASKSWWSRLFE